MSLVRFCGQVHNICCGYDKNRHPIETTLKLGQELEILAETEHMMYKVQDKEENTFYLYAHEIREPSVSPHTELAYWIDRCRHAEESLNDIVDLVRAHEKLTHE